MNGTRAALIAAECEECYAICNLCDIRWQVVRTAYEDNSRIRHMWIHNIYSVDPTTGALLRQETVEGLDPATWRAAVKRLVSVRLR